VIAFHRTDGVEHMLVLGSLNNHPFANGYWFESDSSRLPSGGWKEVFNSDGNAYGGDDVGNWGATLSVTSGAANVVIPANGFVVLQKTS